MYLTCNLLVLTHFEILLDRAEVSIDSTLSTIKEVVVTPIRIEISLDLVFAAISFIPLSIHSCLGYNEGSNLTTS